MGRHAKTDGTFTITDPDGRIVSNVATNAFEAPNPVGPITVDDPFAPRPVVCDACGAAITDAEARTRSARGWLVHCPACTDPTRAGEYGLWRCLDCGKLAYQCTCMYLPKYCSALGCPNARGVLHDDGTCDECDATAIAVTHGMHVCDDHDVDGCNECGVALDFENYDGMCGNCFDRAGGGINEFD